MTADSDLALGIHIAQGLCSLADLTSLGFAPLPDAGAVTIAYTTADLDGLTRLAESLALIVDGHPEPDEWVTGVEMTFGPVTVRIEHHAHVTEEMGAVA